MWLLRDWVGWQWMSWNCIALYMDVVTELYRIDMGVMELYCSGCGCGGIVVMAVQEGAQCYVSLVIFQTGLLTALFWDPGRFFI